MSKKLGVWVVIILCTITVGLNSAMGSRHTSSGTGGNAWRGEEARVFADIDLPSQIRENRRVAIPQNPEVQESINDWLTMQYEMDYELRSGRVANLLNVKYKRMGMERIAVFDLTTGKKLKLSDVFYDGLDYIAYINEYIVFHLDESLEMFAFEYAETICEMVLHSQEGEEYVDTSNGDVKQAVLKRSFQGFDSDHPFFTVIDGLLCLSIGGYHSDAIPNVKSYGNVFFTVPLTKEVSPFGN
jgi:hypothetical protein